MNISIYMYTHTYVGKQERESTFFLLKSDTLQHTAPLCNTLQRTATHCRTLQHTAPNHFFKEQERQSTFLKVSP